MAMGQSIWFTTRPGWLRARKIELVEAGCCCGETPGGARRRVLIEREEKARSAAAEAGKASATAELDAFGAGD